jgi:hypothetical protein
MTNAWRASDPVTARPAPWRAVNGRHRPLGKPKHTLICPRSAREDRSLINVPSPSVQAVQAL